MAEAGTSRHTFSDRRQMQIRRFYVPEFNEGDELVELPSSEASHALRVLRLRNGDRLQVMNGRGVIADAELVVDADGRRPRDASCRILSCQVFSRRTPSLTLCVAPPRGKAFDLVLREAVELGFSAIQPILCTYGVARSEETGSGCQEPLVAALKQSSNPFLPEMRAPVGFAESLGEPPSDGGLRAFGASPRAEATERRVLTPGNARRVTQIWIGPEGGFTRDEEDALLEAGGIPVTLGECVLRVETAVPALAGCVYGVAALQGGGE